MRYTSEATDGLAGIGSIDLTTIANITGFKVGGVAMKKAVEPAIESDPKARIPALIAQSAADSDVRYELVAALRAKMAAGTYRVAASDVAAKLMDSLRK
jgi:hypothetical protein